jgi:dynactin complex subunit
MDAKEIAKLRSEVGGLTNALTIAKAENAKLKKQGRFWRAHCKEIHPGFACAMEKRVRELEEDNYKLMTEVAYLRREHEFASLALSISYDSGDE